MNTSNDVEIVSQFESALGACTTRHEAADLLKSQYADDELLRQASERRKAYQRLKNERCKTIRREQLAPFDDEARRFKRGQKVFFKKSIKSFALGWNLQSIKGSEKRIEAGDWCRVWQYQPQAKRLWLCRPGKQATHANVIRDCFSLTDMMDLGISRTELALRK